MAARSSFSRFFIYCQVFDCNPVDLFLQVHFPSLSLPVFVSLLVSYEIPQTVEHSLSTSFLSKEALLLIYQCFESCDMKTWLVINIVLISQTCFAMLTIFSRTTFSSKKENLIARLSKKSANRGMPQICFLGLW